MSGLGALAAGFGAPSARAAEGRPEFAFEEQVLEVPGERLARRLLLLVPSVRASVRGVVILLHGLGETGSEPVGIRAWADRYGLLLAARRLCGSLPLRSDAKPALLTDERLAELEVKLASRPFEALRSLARSRPTSFASRRPRKRSTDTRLG